MVLMAALRKGMNPFSTYYVSKQLEPGWLPSAPSYGVSTYDHTYKGTINIEQALLRSDNSVFAQLDADVGPEEVRQTAYDMGIKTKLDAYPAEGLGGLTIGVSPLEMASAYATIAAEGVRRDPIAITKVVFPDRKVDDLGKPEGKQVFSDGVAYEAIKLLRANVTSGTGTNAAISCPAAGKTGTTSDFKDAWFAGFTPKLSTAVWVGYPSAGIQMTNVHGMSVSGSTFPSFIWHDFMQVAVGGDCADFPQPSTPFESQPWFGKYATTGTEKDRNYDKTDTTGGADGTGGTPADGADGNGKGNGGNPYKDPNLYEKPPQPPPRVEPPRGGGPGNGRGNGQGNGPDSQTGGNAPPPGGF
jgi:penicillin-binding protein 1A